MRTELQTALIEAHRSENWELARVLSQEKQKAKKIHHCADCGVRISGDSMRCQMHANVYQFWHHRLTVTR